jgi:NAD(P)H-dependent flavin oxidoreductase YrpB (nitropropane dioxygenase family)
MMGMSAEQVTARAEEVAGAGVLAANFLTADIDLAAVEAAAARFPILDFFWSDPDAQLVDLARSRGARVIWQTGSVEEARRAEECGADAVAVQGSEAGGHIRGETALLPLLESVLATVTVPVLAAGGIATARGLAAVQAAGAAGARIGTRFLATTESGAHPGYVAALLAAGPDDTEISDSFARCPLCASVPRARVLRSAVAAVRTCAADTVGTATMGDETVVLPRHAGMPPHRGVRGHIEAMAMYAGQSVGAITDVRRAGDLVRELAEQAPRLLDR